MVNDEEALSCQTDDIMLLRSMMLYLNKNMPLRFIRVPHKNRSKQK
ncbi:MAG: hypothetical protein ACI936_004319 [Paraglaciecola sp.]|jgi:hypothetical protein